MSVKLLELFEDKEKHYGICFRMHNKYGSVYKQFRKPQKKVNGCFFRQRAEFIMQSKELHENGCSYGSSCYFSYRYAIIVACLESSSRAEWLQLLAKIFTAPIFFLHYCQSILLSVRFNIKIA